MSTNIFTGRLGATGSDPDEFDITRKGALAWARRNSRPVAEAPGHPFAPSWAILGPALTARDSAAALAANGNQPAADRVMARAWERYRIAYGIEMAASYHEHRAAWNALLHRRRVVLACVCPDVAVTQRCHRFLLADLLGDLDAEVCGELMVPARARHQLQLFGGQ